MSEAKFWTNHSAHTINESRNWPLPYATERWKRKYPCHGNAHNLITVTLICAKAYLPSCFFHVKKVCFLAFEFLAIRATGIWRREHSPAQRQEESRCFQKWALSQNFETLGTCTDVSSHLLLDTVRIFPYEKASVLEATSWFH